MSTKTASLYLRHVGTAAYQRVEFKKGKPSGIPPKYAGQFYLRLSERGKRLWKGYSSLDEALTARANITTNLDRKQQGLPPIPEAHFPTVGERLTLTDAIQTFITRNTDRVRDWRNGSDTGLSTGSAALYQKAVEDFQTAMNVFGLGYIDELKDSERGKTALLFFKRWLQENVSQRGGKAAYAYERKFVVLNQFLSRHGIKIAKNKNFTLTDPGLLEWSDVPRVKKPKATDVIYYEPSDLAAIVKATDQTDVRSMYTSEDLKDIIATFLLTGMRDEEVQHLEWTDIIWQNGDGRGKIVVQDKPAYDWRVKDHEKRTITLDSTLKARLLARQKREGKAGLVFPNRGEAPSEHFAKLINRLQRWARESGYVFSRPETHRHALHNFRHTYATMLDVNGESTRTIQARLGHSNLTTTERYLAIVEDADKVRKQYAAVVASLAPKT
jgi:integrase